VSRAQMCVPVTCVRSGKYTRRTRLLAHALCSLLLSAAAPLRAQDRPASAQTAAADANWGLSIALRVENGNQRSFRQLEPTTGETRTYRATVYGGVGVSVGYERSFGHDQLSWSLSADYWRSLFFTSGGRRLGKIVDTTAQRMSALAGLALHPADAQGGTYGWLLAGIGAMRFDFALPNDDETMELATGDYTYASVGFAGRVPVSALTLALRSSYLMGFHTGAFGAREVKDQPQGVDALAALDYRVLPWLDLGVQGGLTVLWLRLDPLPVRRKDAPAEVRDLYVVLGLTAKAHL
jgi:hypothetical protein